MKGARFIVRKFILLIVSIMIVITLSVTAFIAWNMRMVVGSAEDLTQILISVPEFYEGKSFVLETDAEMTELYNIIKKTKNKRFGSYEGGGTPQHDGSFRISLFYSTGKTEILRGGSTTTDLIIKENVNLLFSKKFLIGENQLLSEYIETLMS
jgi:hypothetical protein